MRRAEGQKEELRWTDELTEQQSDRAGVEEAQCDKGGLRAVPIKRDELPEKESVVHLESLPVKWAHPELGMKLCLWLIEYTINLIKQEV